MNFCVICPINEVKDKTQVAVVIVTRVDILSCETAAHRHLLAPPLPGGPARARVEGVGLPPRVRVVKERAGHLANLETGHPLGFCSWQTIALSAIYVVDPLADQIVWIATPAPVLLTVSGAFFRRCVVDHARVILVSCRPSDPSTGVEEILHRSISFGEHLALVVCLLVVDKPVTRVSCPRMAIALANGEAEVEVNVQALKGQVRVAVRVVPVRALAVRQSHIVAG